MYGWSDDRVAPKRLNFCPQAERTLFLDRVFLRCSKELLNSRYGDGDADGADAAGEEAAERAKAARRIQKLLVAKVRRWRASKHRAIVRLQGAAAAAERGEEGEAVEEAAVREGTFVGYGSALCLAGAVRANAHDTHLLALPRPHFDALKRGCVAAELDEAVAALHAVPALAAAPRRDPGHRNPLVAAHGAGGALTFPGSHTSAFPLSPLSPPPAHSPPPALETKGGPPGQGAAPPRAAHRGR